jgi:hypothetical protein
MYALIKNGQIVSTTGEPKKLFPNISFPAGAPTKEWLAANDIFEIVDQPHKDQRFYWVNNTGLQVIDGIPTRTYTNTPKELEDITEVVNGKEVVKEGLKTQWINIAKDTANKLLAQTDWVVVRKAERGVEIPQAIAAERAKIIADTEAKEAAIAACTTVEELMAVV